MKTDLIEIFQTLRAQLQPYAVEGFKNKINTQSAYHLCSEHNKDEIYFFGLEVKEDYVGFYFNPNYTLDEMNLIFSPELSNQLIGKDCLQFTKLNDSLLAQFSNILKTSFKIYKQKGWV